MIPALRSIVTIFGDFLDMAKTNVSFKISDLITRLKLSLAKVTRR